MLERITATIFLTILFPFFALISVSIYIFSGRPILFKHKRCGYKFDDFYVIKFRTMRPNKGPSLTGFQDKRITGIGKILRKLKLDELPQLANIIKGEMVFIGPRPESIDIVNNHKNYFTYLETIKPGITDINSIIFKDGAPSPASSSNGDSWQSYRRLSIAREMTQSMPTARCSSTCASRSPAAQVRSSVSAMSPFSTTTA